MKIIAIGRNYAEHAKELNNPVPGVPDHVDALSGKVSAAVDALTRSNQLLGRLRDGNSGVWQGDAGDAFREHVDTTLVTDLTHAQASLESAVRYLAWSLGPKNIRANAISAGRTGVESSCSIVPFSHSLAIVSEVRIDATTVFTIFDGIAKPIPTEPPLRE